MQPFDRTLMARVSEYVQERDGSPIDVYKMVQDLQTQYKEYARRRRLAFINSVKAVYNSLTSSQNGRRSEENGNEKRNDRGKKRKRKPGRSADSDEISIISMHSSVDDIGVEGDGDLILYQDTNLMNSSLSNLYRAKQNADETPVVVNQAASTMLKEGFFIDKTPATTSKDDGTDRKRSTKKKPKSDGAAERQPAKPREVIVLETSKFTFADVGGMETELLELGKMLLRMKNPEIYRALGSQPPRGFLLHGPPGCGKTLLAYAVAGELGIPFIKLAATELVSGVSGESEQKIRDLFDQAMASAPCILFVDEIDAIAPRRETAHREMERRIVAQFVSCLDEVNNSGKHVILIGATHRPDSLDPGLRRAGRFDKEIALGIPNEKARAKILQVVCKNMRLESDLDYLRLARLCPGYVGADLAQLATEATASAIDRIFERFSAKTDLEEKPSPSSSSLADKLRAAKEEFERVMQWVRDGLPFGEDDLKETYVTMKDFEVALRKVVPSAKREGFATVPDVTWRDIGALSDVREQLKWDILHAVHHPEAFESVGLESKPQGILLWGPPGCGKTLLAKAVSNEAAMNFISVKGPELINMYVGESERAVREVFQRARNSAPCVIFFDELDALCPKRSSVDSGSSARVVNQLLTEMDGIEGRRQVFIIGATNRPDMIDPAILRPGRLGKKVYVGFPSAGDKADVLRALIKDDKPKLAEDVDLTSIACDPRAECFTGADLAALVREASMNALKEQMTDDYHGGVIIVAMKHFECAYLHVEPSVTLKERERYLNLKRKYESGGK